MTHSSVSSLLMRVVTRSARPCDYRLAGCLSGTCFEADRWHQGICPLGRQKPHGLLHAHLDEAIPLVFMRGGLHSRISFEISAKGPPFFTPTCSPRVHARGLHSRISFEISAKGASVFPQKFKRWS